MQAKGPINPNQAKVMTPPGEPVPGFPISFSWHANYWPEIFDEQIKLIREDIARARVDDKMIVYLSCPISSRGGGYSGTNVEIAKTTERRLLTEWGDRFWILNPAQYQLESKEGTGLIMRHARALGYSDGDIAQLRQAAPPVAGDYMRMWTKVLVDESGFHTRAEGDPNLRNTGQHFDAFYFLGPTDGRKFFALGGGESVTAALEDYFSRKYSGDPDFRDAFSVSGLTWPTQRPQDDGKRREWDELRTRFFRFYSLRASVNFSLGSHDEWNIFRVINERRRNAANGDVGEQLGGFFDGRQIEPGAAESPLSKGYAR